MGKKNMDDTKDFSEEEIFEKTKDYEEEYKVLEEENKEYIESEHHHHRNNKKKVILIVITILLFLICIGCIVYLLLKDKNSDEKPEIPTQTTQIQRPSNNIEYTVLKQNNIGMNCKKTKQGDKYKKLSKGMIIDCNFGYEANANSKITELYFDLNASSNIKLKDIKNNSGYKLVNDENTYLLTFDSPQSVLDNVIHFYYEVINDDKTGFVEVNNIIFKDSNDLYYKVLNNIETFPPEYDDKIYIYESTYDESDEVFYYSSKTVDSEQKLFDTFQCQNDTCETIAESSHYFLINDNKLVLYDSFKKTTVTIDTPEELKIDDYSYELMHNAKGNIYGVALKRNYKSAFDCNNLDGVCVNKGLSGYEIGYYSLKEKRFTIDPDLKIIGSSAYQEYDYAIMLKKGNTYGVYSLEDDKMVVEFTDKIKAMDFDYFSSSITMELYDEANDEYYFTYYDPVGNTNTLKTSNLIKFEDSTIYYLEDINHLAKEVTMLFDKNGNQLKKMPYVLKKDLVAVNNNIIINSVLEGYLHYDLDGNYLFKTGYYHTYILDYSKNYILAKSELNKLEVLDNNGKIVTELDELNDKVTYVSSKEFDNTLLVIVKDTNITEEGKNAKQYTIKDGKLDNTELIFVE